MPERRTFVASCTQASRPTYLPPRSVDQSDVHVLWWIPHGLRDTREPEVQLTVMFMMYAVIVGLVVGLLLGGRIDRLADLRLEWVWLALTGLAIQVVLFTEPVNVAAGELVPVIYVASTALVLLVILRNMRKAPGLAIVALGACSNLAAIIANGGYMPATPAALGIAEPVATTYRANSVSMPHPTLEPLVDRFSLPDWVPFANVFSIGDVLIGIGIVVVIVVAMRGSRSRPGGMSAPGSPATVARASRPTGGASAP